MCEDVLNIFHHGILGNPEILQLIMFQSYIEGIHCNFCYMGHISLLGIQWDNIKFQVRWKGNIL